MCARGTVSEDGGPTQLVSYLVPDRERLAGAVSRRGLLPTPGGTGLQALLRVYLPLYAICVANSRV